MTSLKFCAVLQRRSIHLSCSGLMRNAPSLSRLHEICRRKVSLPRLLPAHTFAAKAPTLGFACESVRVELLRCASHTSAQEPPVACGHHRGQHVVLGPSSGARCGSLPAAFPRPGHSDQRTADGERQGPQQLCRQTLGPKAGTDASASSLPQGQRPLLLEQEEARVGGTAARPLQQDTKASTGSGRTP